MFLLDPVELGDLGIEDVDLALEGRGLVLRVVHLEEAEHAQADHDEDEHDGRELERTLHLPALAPEDHLGWEQVELLHVLRAREREPDDHGHGLEQSSPLSALAVNTGSRSCCCSCSAKP